jgi:hypothetical protein
MAFKMESCVWAFMDDTPIKMAKKQIEVFILFIFLKQF